MARCCFTVAVGFIFVCIQGVVLGQTLNRSVRSVTPETANVVPPGTDRFIVTLEIFSGAPDPQWVITPDHPKYTELKTALSDATTYNPETYTAPSKLGYQGFRLQVVESGNKQPEVLVVGPESKNLQLLLLQTIPDHWVSTALSNSIKEEIEEGKVKAVERPVTPVTEATSKRYAPWYKPSDWNDGFHVFSNNCYNYANDKRTDTFAQPGNGGGRPLPDVFTDEDLKRSSEADGLRFKKARKHMCIPKHPRRHLVALFIYNGTDPTLPFNQDYHWYRLDNNGHWSHKAGGTPVTDRDGNGDRIVDPRTAAQGRIPYEFVCFMTTNRKSVNIW
ncbi:uncharacterized protein LOC144663945 [Oculina patagonica]